jgi:hypothetical protein
MESTIERGLTLMPAEEYMKNSPMFSKEINLDYKMSFLLIMMPFKEKPDIFNSILFQIAQTQNYIQEKFNKENSTENNIVIHNVGNNVMEESEKEHNNTKKDENNNINNNNNNIFKIDLSNNNDGDDDADNDSKNNKSNNKNKNKNNKSGANKKTEKKFMDPINPPKTANRIKNLETNRFRNKSKFMESVEEIDDGRTRSRKKVETVEIIPVESSAVQKKQKKVSSAPLNKKKACVNNNKKMQNKVSFDEVEHYDVFFIIIRKY